MVEVNLKEYGNILLTKTNTGEFLWEQSGEYKYRLVVPKGSIVIERLFSSIAATYYYEISFYGTTTLIYTGKISRSDSLYSQYVQLFDTIVSKNNEKINSEITELFV
jgi:hypothetical protein